MEKLKAQMASAKGDSKYNNLQSIEKRLKELKFEQNTSSMTLKQEKDLIKEMESLSSARKMLAKVGAAKDKFTGNKEASASLGDLIGEVNGELKAINVLMDEQKAILDKINEKAGAAKEADLFPKLMAEKDELKKKVDAEYTAIRDMRAEWRTVNNEWFEYSKILRAQREVEWAEETARRDAEWAA